MSILFILHCNYYHLVQYYFIFLVGFVHQVSVKLYLWRNVQFLRDIWEKVFCSQLCTLFCMVVGCGAVGTTLFEDLILYDSWSNITMLCDIWPYSALCSWSWPYSALCSWSFSHLLSLKFSYQFNITHPLGDLNLFHYCAPFALYSRSYCWSRHYTPPVPSFQMERGAQSKGTGRNSSRAAKCSTPVNSSSDSSPHCHQRTSSDVQIPTGLTLDLRILVYKWFLC